MDSNVTQEQLDQYAEEVAAHELFIENYRYFLERICNHLDWVQGLTIGDTRLWTTAEIRKIISDEINKSESMDAPNKPGYYRANND